MKHQVKVTVIDKKLFPELQRQYCANPCSGPCSCYNVGDEFLFRRDDERDDYWHMGLGTLTKTSADPDTVAGARRCRTAQKRGTPSAAIFTPVCRAVPSCVDG